MLVLGFGREGSYRARGFALADRFAERFGTVSLIDNQAIDECFFAHVDAISLRELWDQDHRSRMGAHRTGHHGAPGRVSPRNSGRDSAISCSLDSLRPVCDSGSGGCRPSRSAHCRRNAGVPVPNGFGLGLGLYSAAVEWYGPPSSVLTFRKGGVHG